MVADNGGIARALVGISPEQELLRNCLLEDAPPNHEAWHKVKRCQSSSMGNSAMYSFTMPGKKRFQTTLKACHLLEDQALRIARLCYVKVSEGWTKEETTSYRDALYDEVRAAQVSGLLPSPSGDPDGEKERIGSAVCPSPRSPLASPVEPQPEPQPTSPVQSPDNINTQGSEDSAKIIAILREVIGTNTNQSVGPYRSGLAQVNILIQGLPESEAKRRCVLCMRAQERHFKKRILVSWRPFVILAVRVLDPAVAEELMLKTRWPPEVCPAETMAMAEQAVIAEEGLTEELGERGCKRELEEEEALNPDGSKARKLKQEQEEGVPQEKKNTATTIRREQEESCPKEAEKIATDIKLEQEEGVPKKKKKNTATTIEKAATDIKLEQEEGVAKKKKKKKNTATTIRQEQEESDPKEVEQIATEIKLEQAEAVPKKEEKRRSVKKVVELFRREGRLDGAVRIQGRDPAKKNCSINGVYAPLKGGYAGALAFELHPSEPLKRFLFFSSPKGRWKIHDELEDGKGCCAYLKGDDGQNPPVGLASGVYWKLFDGKSRGYVDDPAVVCSLVPSNSKAEASSDSDSSSSDSDSEAPSAAVALAKPGTKKLAAGPRPPRVMRMGKMLVHCGLRCACHFAYMRDCPDTYPPRM